MFRSSRVFAAGLAAALSLAVAAPVAVSAKPTKNLNKLKGNQSQNKALSHLHHLHRAIADFRAAETALTGNNSAKAHKDIQAAIHQIGLATAHHQKHHATQGTNALAGGLGAAQHHKHHGHLHQAVADGHAAEKQIKAGNTAGAQTDLNAAIKQVNDAIAQHHHGKGNNKVAAK